MKWRVSLHSVDLELASSLGVLRLCSWAMKVLLIWPGASRRKYSGNARSGSVPKRMRTSEEETEPRS